MREIAELKPNSFRSFLEIETAKADQAALHAMTKFFRVSYRGTYCIVFWSFIQAQFVWSRTSRKHRFVIGLLPRRVVGGGRAPETWRGIAKTDAYVTSRRERKKIEMLFAHLKRILRLDRLRLSGPCGTHDEFLLAATAQNLRKLAKLVPAPGSNACLSGDKLVRADSLHARQSHRRLLLHNRRNASSIRDFSCEFLSVVGIYSVRLLALTYNACQPGAEARQCAEVFQAAGGNGRIGRGSHFAERSAGA